MERYDYDVTIRGFMNMYQCDAHRIPNRLFFISSMAALDAAALSEPKSLTLKLPLVPLDEFNFSYEELALRCHSLSKTNAELRREYDAMVLEKSAALTSLRQQLAAIAQDELLDSDSPPSQQAVSASFQEELSDLKSVVEFLQQEEALTKAALKGSESRALQCSREAEELKLQLSAARDSVLVYEHSFSDAQAKFVKEAESCALLKLSLKDSEEKRQHSDVRAAELALQLRRCVAENEERIGAFERFKCEADDKQRQQHVELERLRECSLAQSDTIETQKNAGVELRDRHQALETAFAALEEQNRVLLEKNESMGASLQDCHSTIQQQRRDLESVAERLAVSEAQVDALKLQEHAQTRAASDRCNELDALNGDLVAQNSKLAAQMRELESKVSSMGAVMQSTLAEYKRTTREVKIEFQEQLAASKKFASKFAAAESSWGSNSVKSHGGSSASRRVLVPQVSSSDDTYIATPSRPDSTVVGGADSRASIHDPFYKSNHKARATPGNTSAHSSHASLAPNASFSHFSERIPPPVSKQSFKILTPNALSVKILTPGAKTFGAEIKITDSDTLQLLDEACVELASAALDLKSHATELQSLATSTATILNEYPPQIDMFDRSSNTFHETTLAYLKSISHCETRLRDLDFPITTCSRTLLDTLHALSVGGSAADVSSLHVLSSQLSDASSAIELAVRSTEAPSIKLRAILDEASAQSRYNSSSDSRSLHHAQRQDNASSKMTAARSCINQVLGAVLSCRSRICECAEVAAACHHKVLEMS